MCPNPAIRKTGRLKRSRREGAEETVKKFPGEAWCGRIGRTRQPRQEICGKGRTLRRRGDMPDGTHNPACPERHAKSPQKVINMNDLEKMTSGAWLHAYKPEIFEALMRAEELVFRLNQLAPSRTAEREAILRRLLGRIGRRFTIHSPFRCDFGTQISIGEDFVGNFNLTILDEAPVEIGDHVFIGPNVSLYTVTHALCADQRNEGIMRSLPIRIGDDVWIGGDTVVLQGVTIGRGAVIGAGSVVRHDIPPQVVAAGNPCRVLRPITEADRIENALE